MASAEKANNVEDARSSESTDVVEHSRPVSKFTRWYRSPLFNVILVGLISFTQPGIWNALNNTGAGGQQEPYLVNGANSLTFGHATFPSHPPISTLTNPSIMVFGCSLFGILANKIGIKTVLIIGTLGQLIGASIQLSLNVKTQQRGKVSYTTYLVLIALQCLGLPLALLVSPPEKIIKPDGSKLNLRKKKTNTLKEEFSKSLALIKRKEMFLLIPIMVGFQWNSTYLGIYMAKYFSVRSRTLGSLTSGIAATFANIFWGWFYDLKRFRRPTLAKACWFFFVILMLGTFGWQVNNEYVYAASEPRVTLDWDLPGFGRGFASMVILRFLNESHYMFVYWLIGAFFDDLETLTLAVGIMRSFESLGSCIAFGIGAAKVTPMVNLVIAFAMFGLTIPATSWVVYLVPERPVHLRKEVEGETSEEEVSPVVVSKAAEAVDGPHP
ncbi:hypothetical protein OQA88_11038 [Cercophora sp. LCS_1]